MAHLMFGRDTGLVELFKVLDTLDTFVVHAGTHEGYRNSIGTLLLGTLPKWMSTCGAGGERQKHGVLEAILGELIDACLAVAEYKEGVGP